MAFCRFCGAQLENENIPCDKCSGQADQYYQPMPQMQPIPQQKDEAGKILGIIMLVIVIIVIIVIVVAAVLYVMVIGFGSSSGYSTPVGAWTNLDATSSTSAELSFGYFSGEVAPEDIRIYITENGTDAGHIQCNGEIVASSTTMMWTSGPSGASAEYRDLNYAGGTINPGDRIILNGLKPDTEYSFEIYHIPTDGTISMAGAGSELTTDA